MGKLNLLNIATEGEPVCVKQETLKDTEKARSQSLHHQPPQIVLLRWTSTILPVHHTLHLKTILEQDPKIHKLPVLQP